jgi:glycosyltransferase involved in cell wall biosynthesis
VSLPIADSITLRISRDRDCDTPLGRRLKAVIGHPYMGRGGSEARVMWLIEALKRDYDITVITTGGWDLTALNTFYGTAVSETEVRVLIASLPWPLRYFKASAARGACYQRLAREVAAQFDLRISAYNTTDWGLPAIHYIADFSWHRGIRDRLHPPSPGFIYRDSILRKVYLRLASAYGSPSGRDVLREDLLIANSQWTASLLKQVCDVHNAEVVYPSVWTEFPDVRWEDKEQAFVIIGRIAPEKQIERAIAIIEAVRSRGFSILLYLCGHIGSDLYGQSIARLCRDRAEWIISEGQVSGAKKTLILARCRFGIQTCGAESFGISVAEMVKAGAIVFATNEGGQTEILSHPDLLFANMDEAVAKICTILASPTKQMILRNHLSHRAEMFSADRFIEAVRNQNKKSLNTQRSNENRRLPKVVIGHPKLGFGGSESTVMWLIEALKREWDVTVVTTGGWNLEALNTFYGTTVHAEEIRVRIASVPLLARGLSVAALRGTCYQRFAREIAGEYDMRISAYNLTDWGLPAIHFIADFSWHRDIRERLHPLSRGFIYRDSILRKAYLSFASAYGRPSNRDVLREDLVIANSKWTADILKLPCGLQGATVVYPPVWTEFPTVLWEKKELAFVMIGRIAPEKQVERAIAILEAVRERGYTVQFHLCGRIGKDRYGKSIARLCKDRNDWITLEGQVSGTKKAQILARCRFGIQTTSAESFGIAVAEMIKAGAIVFAPSDGGTAETLQHPALLFANTNDAVDKIQAVLETPSLQSALQIHLNTQASLFSAQTFMREARICIADLLSANQTKDPAIVGPSLVNEVLCTGSH